MLASELSEGGDRPASSPGVLHCGGECGALLARSGCSHQHFDGPGHCARLQHAVEPSLRRIGSSADPTAGGGGSSARVAEGGARAAYADGGGTARVEEEGVAAVRESTTARLRC
eukprot:1182712-Prorocentrum_minimum.AAC.3